MTKQKGRLVYAPSVVIEEVQDVMRDHDVHQQSEAFRKMVEYCRVGREMERIMTLDWRPRYVAKKKNNGRGLF